MAVFSLSWEIWPYLCQKQLKRNASGGYSPSLTRKSNWSMLLKYAPMENEVLSVGRLHTRMVAQRPWSLDQPNRSVIEPKPRNAPRRFIGSLRRKKFRSTRAQSEKS